MQAKKFKKIIQALNSIYNIKKRTGKPFEALLGGILSHRTKDETTFPALERLLKKANTPTKILLLPEHEIAKTIYPVGFYPTKAKRIIAASRELLERFNGKVPQDRGALMSLPGVGGKTADIVLLFAFGEAVIPVDTHVYAISRRFGIATEKDNPEKVREKLHALVPEKDRFIVNQLLVQFGREICVSPRPKCYKCPILKLCPYEPKNLALKTGGTIRAQEPENELRRLSP